MSRSLKTAIITGIITGILVAWHGYVEYKRGFTDGVQSRIDYEHGRDIRQ